MIRFPMIRFPIPSSAGSLGTSALAAAAVLAATLGTAAPAAADSCWNHNGSIMRLKADGSSRAFLYERPRGVLARAGVRRGTLLFDGVKRGNAYEGMARTFSRFCPGNPNAYSVSGPVSADQLRVTLVGTRDAYERCEYTGNVVTDTLVFTYAYDC